MSPELDKRLCETYPLLFKDRHGDMRLTAMCWGFEVGDGWYSLIESLCGLIYWPHEQARQRYERLCSGEGAEPGQGVPGLVDAAELERARLDMEMAAEAIPLVVQVKEKFGALRFYVRNGNEAVQRYIEFAQYHSYRVCERCGCPGTLREGGWLQTLCDEHAASRRGGT